MVGRIKTRNEEETKEIVDDLRSEISRFFESDPFPDNDYDAGIEIAFHGNQKIIAIDDEAIPIDHYYYDELIEKIEEIVKVPWNSWGYNRHFDDVYYYIYVDEEN